MTPEAAEVATDSLIDVQIACTPSTSTASAWPIWPGTTTTWAASSTVGEPRSSGPMSGRCRLLIDLHERLVAAKPDGDGAAGAGPRRLPLRQHRARRGLPHRRRARLGAVHHRQPHRRLRLVAPVLVGPGRPIGFLQRPAHPEPDLRAPGRGRQPLRPTVGLRPRRPCRTTRVFSLVEAGLHRRGRLRPPAQGGDGRRRSGSRSPATSPVGWTPCSTTPPSWRRASSEGTRFLCWCWVSGTLRGQGYQNAVRSPGGGYQRSMTLAQRMARPLLAGVFVVGGIDALRNPGPRVKKVESVVPGMAEAIGLPSDPDHLAQLSRRLVTLNSVVHVGAGTLLALGRLPRLSAGVLALAWCRPPWPSIGFGTNGSRPRWPKSGPTFLRTPAWSAACCSPPSIPGGHRLWPGGPSAPPKWRGVRPGGARSTSPGGLTRRRPAVRVVRRVGGPGGPAAGSRTG